MKVVTKKTVNEYITDTKSTVMGVINGKNNKQ